MKAGPNHFDDNGNAVMVDVSAKSETLRTAVAKGKIKMLPKTLAIIQSGTAKKGDVLGVARVAGIMAAKRTWELIPLCHPLLLEKCTVDFELLPDENAVQAAATVQVSGKTGVEMEALAAVTTSLLTIYDMCKAVDRGMQITDVCLWHKAGGKSGAFAREEAE